jgi:hypothetical protein
MRVYWKWVIKSVPILGLTLLMLATTVTPRQAHSNVEAWLNYFGIEDVPLLVATKSIDAWIFWIAFVGVGLWGAHLYVRWNIVKGKMSVVIREEEPWVQVNSGIDQSHVARTGGQLYTYRVALVNSHDSTLRNVEVKLISLEKQPQNFSAIGSHLKLRHDQAGATNFNIHPTKDPECMDAMFVDVFRFYLGPGGHSSLSVTSLPEESNRPLPVDKYDVKIMATSESGEMAIADMAFIPHPDHIPDLKLLRMQSFPGR